MKDKKRWILSLVKNSKQHQKLKTKLQEVESLYQDSKEKIRQLEIQNKDFKNRFHALESKVNKLTPQVYLRILEIHLAEHCNLNCFSCSHFSQLAKEGFPNLNQYECDLKRLSNLTYGLIGRFHLMGGEPLLNPNCKDFFQVTRKYFPKSAIWLVTNGILLESQSKDFWESCKENKIEIHPTKYPIKVNWEVIEQKCKDFGIPLIFFNNTQVIKASLKFVLEPKGNCNPLDSFVKCGMANNCVQLRNGKLYPCNIAPNIQYFNAAFHQNLPITPIDFIDIYKAKDYHEILQFLAKPIPFCRFCNLAKWKSIGEWKTSKKEIGEYLE
ncbi:4Fe-4S cluster-binding domain-containing protein [Helicobacter sp. MIT 05-5294]|uniref:4Fe-4S cluster-binding domain-containing protein n=1 Tax=Helicobacter sp. MIT 05-5294 TaxID=1548150 RepID=UPI0010FF4BD5|nr:4Fe-4S cluster-binding domain-containing protein [Helicobacter sp. MIT 05-5294]TLD88663.1 4Fe-4S cluster-binding domain-containing protein [Helicobacter sp. MIT 05-5294]